MHFRDFFNPSAESSDFRTLSQRFQKKVAEQHWPDFTISAEKAFRLNRGFLASKILGDKPLISLKNRGDRLILYNLEDNFLLPHCNMHIMSSQKYEFPHDVLHFVIDSLRPINLDS